MPHYTQFFGFQGRPFEAEGSNAPVLGTEALATAFEEIEAALACGQSAILLQGPPGIGMTSLARALPKLLAGIRPVTLIRDASQSCTELETLLASTAAANPPLSADPAATLLVIDNAELITETSLRSLVDALASELTQPRLVCLFCLTDREPEPGPDEIVRPALTSLSPAQITLAPLSLAGVRQYIRRHLERVGEHFEDLFPDDTVKAIHSHSGGIPKNVSRLCEELLTTAAQRQTKTLDPEWLEETTDFETHESPAAEKSAPSQTSPPNHDLRPSSESEPRAIVSPHSHEWEADGDTSMSTQARMEPEVTSNKRARTKQWGRRLAATLGVVVACSLASVLFGLLGASDESPIDPAPQTANPGPAERASESFEPRVHAHSTIPDAAGRISRSEAKLPATVEAFRTGDPDEPIEWMSAHSIWPDLEIFEDPDFPPAARGAGNRNLGPAPRPPHRDEPQKESRSGVSPPALGGTG